jgi:glycerol-3-phosphate dehydrogenase (NAD(P)+)
MKAVSPYLPRDSFIVSVSKGIEEESLMTMSDVLTEVLPQGFHDRLLALSGPSFAKEVGQKKPTAVVIASKNEELARCAQNIFNTPYFRVYTNDDITGVELAGTYKNVIAIATGISDGFGLGLNAKAALMARGLAEIARLGLAMGANPATCYGLAGVGDLVLTCTGDLSRNRSVGIKLGQGMKIEEILNEMKMVAEGIKNTRSIVKLGEKYGVELPIANKVYEFIFQNKDIKEVISELMGRDLKGEIDKK